MREYYYHAWFYLDKLGFSRGHIAQSLQLPENEIEGLERADKLPPDDMARWFACQSKIDITLNRHPYIVCCVIIGIEIYHLICPG